MSRYPSRIRHTQAGDPVSAPVASAAAKTLEARTNYLKEVLDAVEAGRALIQQDVLVRSDTQVGQPVYWDATNQYYAPAKAGVENDEATNSLVATEASDVAGMVLAKKAGNLADIVLWGLVQFGDLSNVIDESPIPTGRLYLSAQEEGKLVKQRPAVSVSVCLLHGPLDACDENTWVFVMPQMRDFLEDHIHFQYNLVAEPAGTHSEPITGEPHVIADPDVTKQGWLPAGHSSFNGNAPTGAKFGYNLAAHPEVERNWPPIPVSAAVLEMLRPSIYPDVKGPHLDVVLDFPNTPANTASDLAVAWQGIELDDTVLVTPEGGAFGDGIVSAWPSTAGEVTVRYLNATVGAVDPPSQTFHMQVVKANDPPNKTVAVAFSGLERVCVTYVKIDNYGIWWMTDCYNEVPWPTDFDNTGSSSSSSSLSLSSESAAGACPRDGVQVMQLILSFIKMTFATDKTVVTSLQPADGQPIQYVDCNDEEANTGDLFAKILLDLVIDADEYYGGVVFKGVTDTSKFKSGYAVEGIVAGSSKVSLSSTRSRYLTPGDSGTPTVHQEIVTLDVTVDPTDRELLPQIVVLGDTQERLYNNIPYYGFPDGRDAGIRVKFVVPPEGLPDSPTLTIRVVIFGRGAGTMTDLDTSYQRFARPEVGTPTPVVESSTPLVMDTDVVVTADNAVEVESDPFAIAAGDTVYVSIDRLAAGSPSYAHEIGIIRVGAIIEGS
jgi:hypothetical protein